MYDVYMHHLLHRIHTFNNLTALPPSAVIRVLVVVRLLVLA